MARVAAAMLAADAAYDTISLRLRTIPVGPRPIDALMSVCDAVAAEGSSVAAIVGPRFSRQAVLLGGWSAATGVPVISHGATAPSLAEAASYPFFFRTCPADTLLAAALLDALAASSVGRFTIVAQNDEYGLGGLSVLQQLAPSRGLVVDGVLTFAWQATPESIDPVVTALAAADARIIVVWASASQTEALLRAARAHGLVSAKRAWLVSNPVLMGSATDPDGDIYTGLVSVTAAPPRDDGPGRVNLTSVLLRWQVLEPDTFPPNGRLDVFAPYVYDAVLAAAAAAREAVRGGWRPRLFPNGSSSGSSCFGLLPPSPSEVSLAAAVRLISVEGLTGTTSWAAAGADRLLSRVSLQNLVRIPGEAGGAYRRGYVEAALWTPSAAATASSTTAAAGGAEARGSFSPSKPLLVWTNGSTTPPPERDVLRGRVLRVVTLHAPPFVFVDSIAPLRLRGVAIEVLNSLAASLGFFVDMTVSNRSYSALVDAVAAGEFDFLAADITINARRQKIVTLSIPWVEDGLRVVVRKATPEAVVSLGSFLAPFTWRVWVMVLVVMAVGGTLFIIMEHRSNPALAEILEQHKRGTTAAAAASNLKMMSVGIWYVASSFTCADTGIAPTTTPGRLLLLGFTFLWLILVSSFTGGVAAALSAQRLDRSITGFDDIKRGGVAPVRVGAAIGSNTFTVFTQEVGSQPRGFSTLTAALDGVSAGAVDAAVGVGTSLRYTIGQSYCDLEVVGTDWFKSALGYAYPPKFPFAGELDQAILQLKESGGTARIYDSYLVSSCAVQDAGSGSVDALDLVDLAGVFLIAFFFVLAATGIWLSTSYTRGECPRLQAVLTRVLPCACLRRKRRLHVAPSSSSSSTSSSFSASAPSGQKVLSPRTLHRMSIVASSSLAVVGEGDSPSPSPSPSSTDGSSSSSSSSGNRMTHVVNPLSSPSAASTAVPVPNFGGATARREAGLTSGAGPSPGERLGGWDAGPGPGPGSGIELAPSASPSRHAADPVAVNSRATRAARALGGSSAL